MERMFALSKRTNGRINPEIVLREAENTYSPLHSLYEWDKSKALERYYLDRSSEIIRASRIRFVDTTTRTTAYIRAYARDPKKKSGYIGITPETGAPKLDADTKKSIVLEAIKDARALVSSTRTMAYFFGLEKFYAKAESSLVEYHDSV